MPARRCPRVVACGWWLRPAPRQRVEVRIEDTGVGIPPEHLSRIFDLYFTTKEREAASGCRWSIASSRCTTARSRCSPRLVEERPSECCCRERTGFEMVKSTPNYPTRQLPDRDRLFQRARARRRFRSLMAIVLGVGILAAAGAGCAKARAATVPDGPPLAMPQPPPRVFAPVDQRSRSQRVPSCRKHRRPRRRQSRQRRPPRRAAATTRSQRSRNRPRSQLNPRPSLNANCARRRHRRTLKQTTRSERSCCGLTRNLGQVDYQKLSVAGTRAVPAGEGLRRASRRGADTAQLRLRGDARRQGRQARHRTAGR